MNSKGWENLSLRRAYKRENPLCALSPLLAAETSPHIPDGNRGKPLAHDVHHITGGILGTRRWDIPCNLITLRRPVHEWAERYSHDGLALCCLAKLRADEFDPNELSRITRLSFPGYFSFLEPRLVFDVSKRAWEEVMQWMVEFEFLEETEAA